jgi:HK97 family phage major capsid protein
MQLANLTEDLRIKHAVLDYVRWASCLTKTTSPARVAEVFRTRWPYALYGDAVTKAAVAAGTTTDAAWGAPLAPPALAEGFLALVRSASVIGRIPNLKTVPFNVTTAVQTSGGSFYWVAEGTVKPITKLGFAAGITLRPYKAEGIVVVTRELAELVVPGTEPALRDALVSGLTSFTDRAFLDPSIAAVVGKNPASITNGATPITASGNVDTDVAAALAALFTARPGATGAVIITSPATAAKLAGTGKNLDVRIAGGTVHGAALVTSDAALANIIAIDPAAILVADAGVRLDISNEADVEMDDAPVGTVAAAVITSLWQTNQTGFRVERFLNYQAVAGAVQYVANVT